MKLGGLILGGVLGNRARLVFTLGSIAVAFALFGLLLPVNRIFESRIDFADANRLIVINKVSLMRPLPISYAERLREVPNVTTAGHFTFFGAVYRNESNPVAAIVTEPETFSAMVDEVEFREPAQYRAWLADPTGIAVGRQLADRLGWSVGDLVPVHSTIYPRKDGSSAWTFRVAAIFDAATSDGSTDSMVINYRHFDEERSFGAGTVGWYSVRLRDAAKAGETASAIDRLFANSPDETNTVTERAFAQSFLSQVGDFRAMITIALALVFWTLTLIAGNTIAQSIRERFADFAVLKTIGFSRTRVAGLVFGESLLLMIAGGVLGLALAAAAVPLIAGYSNQLLSRLQVQASDWLLGFILMTVIGLVIAAVPALRAARQPIVDGLAEAM